MRTQEPIRFTSTTAPVTILGSVNMPHWLLKTAIHRAISWLPRPQFWNGLLQQHFTRSTELTRERFEAKLRECQRHYGEWRELRSTEQPLTVLELGTGWLPIITLGLHLCGAKEIWTIDIDPLLKTASLKKVLGSFLEFAEEGKLGEYLPGFQPERLQGLRALHHEASGQPPAALLERLGIHVLVADARHLPLPERAISFFVSSGVLEYIPRPVLEGILREFRRTAVPGSVMSHRLNLVDQFSYFDKSIGPFNFLKYTERQWRWRNSPLIWQNRMRISEYRTVLQEAGFAIVREENVSGVESDLPKVTIAPEFQSCRREDLLVLHSYITARLADAGTGH